MKILVAKDEVAIGENYKMILESRNHHVTLTRDGEECILAFNRAHRALQLTNSSTEDNNAFDLVVLDFRMPKKDGFDLAKDILLVCPKKKIIFATAYTLDALDGLMKKVQFGMEVLQKPFDLDAFTVLVEDFGPRSLPSKNTDGIQ